MSSNSLRAASILALSAALLLAGCNARVVTRPVANGAASAVARNGHVDPSRVIVKLKSGDGAGVASRHGLRVAGAIAPLGAVVLAGTNAGGQLAALARDPDVAYAEPSRVLRLDDPRPRAPRHTLGTDPDQDLQWGHAKIHLEAAWALTRGRPDVVVAVLDTGVDVDHPDLRGNLVPGTTFFSEPGPADYFGHGTHVAGIVAASRNGVGGVGVAPGCKVMPVKVMGPRGAEGKVEDVAAGLVWATDHGAKVANLSLGDEGASRLMAEAVRYALAHDVVVVAAAGNFDPERHKTTNTMDYPAAYPGVIAVGASDRSDQVADFSFWGTWLSVVAPGVGVYSTVPTDGSDEELAQGRYEVEDGTSMASPYVAGVAALVRSAHPELSAAQVKARIEASAADLGAPGYDPHFGHGRLDAFRAVAGT